MYNDLHFFSWTVLHTCVDRKRQCLYSIILPLYIEAVDNGIHMIVFIGLTC